MKYLLLLFYCIPILAMGQDEPDRCPAMVFNLTIEVYDLDNEKPIGGSKIQIWGSNGQKTELWTNDSGYVRVENFIQPHTTYTIQVSAKGYLTSDLHGYITSQLNTIGRTRSMEFYKIFRFRKVLCIGYGYK